MHITASPQGVIQQAASSLNLTCSASGALSPPLSYQWTSTCTGNCFVLQQGRSQTLIQSSLHSIDSGNHTCRITDDLGNSGTATIEVAVNGEMSIKVVLNSNV